MKPKTHASSLPSTGPGSSYARPVHVCSLPTAMDIARQAGGPVMGQLVLKGGITRVLKAFPDGRVEVSP